MFRKTFVYEFAGEGRDWPRGHRNWHRGHGPQRGLFGWHMRRGGPGRGPFGSGGPFGGEGFPDRGPGQHFFGRGDLKYALLELLQERPMHGYEMMKELQERTGGRYTPSAGSVYPTLQMLEDRGFVTVSEADGKKVHQITEAGRGFLAENQAGEQGEHRRRGPRHGRGDDWAEVATLWHELRELRPLIGGALKAAKHDPAKIERLRALITQIRSELAAITGDAKSL